MPLLDLFHPPLSRSRSWDGFYGSWPAMIVISLERTLPPDYVAEPQIHLGPIFEIDVAAYGRIGPISSAPDVEPLLDRGGLATMKWAPPKPSLSVATDTLNQDGYEVRVYNTRDGRRLVAAIEIISPANKDRPEHRRAFANKCAALLQSGVCVVVVDIVTERNANLYVEFMGRIGHDDPSFGDSGPSLYAVSCRGAVRGGIRVLEVWSHGLRLGEPLPTLPLWLAEDFAVPLELETSYQETRRILRIP